MVNADDMELLQRYGTEVSEDAFASLVSRHVNLVYSSALRQVRDAHLAEEVTQTVFILLAKKARLLGQGTILAGWLYRATRFVSSEAMRSEHRRRIREHAAMEPLYDLKEQSPWAEIEPMLDEAMAGLGERERNLVLLRYFENKSLKELGGELGITEDAAQKRVARALEKLRAILTQRGAGISTASLAGVLSAFAVQTAPASLAASVLTVVSTPAAAAISTSVLVQTALKIMAFTKVKTAAVAAVILAALSVPVVMQQSALHQAREESEALKAEIQKLRANPVRQPVSPQIDEAEIERVQREASEVHKLRGELGSLRKENRELAKTNSSAKRSNNDASAQTDPMARMRSARDLMAQGNHAEALEHFLWCFDEGLKHSPGFVGVRGSFLLSEIKQLAERYPPALEAMVSRRDASEARLVAGSADFRSIHELIQLNEHLGEPGKNVALFDRLPEGHAARGGLVDLAADQFVKDKRYQDMVQAGNPEATYDRAQLGAKSADASPALQENESLRVMMRRRVVEAGGRGVEALAGVGQFERAKALTDKVLQFDASPETSGELLKHAERAGNADLINYLKGR